MNEPAGSNRPHVLMCRPDFYAIEYEINAWMNTRRQSDRPRARRQWEALYELVQRAGATVSLLSPVQGLPDLVFTANAAMIYRQVALLARFRHPQRQGEESHDDAWFAEHGFEVRRLPPESYFEGAGDALFCGETLFAGYHIRSDVYAQQEVGRSIGVRVIPLELVDPYFYHLDTCFCPLAPGVAIYYPAAFDSYGQVVLGGLIDTLVPVPEDEARQFACNAVVIGRTVITNSGCPRISRQLVEMGYEVWDTPLDEFVKAGGSAKCLTLRLDGEEAAAWKREKLAL